DVFEWNDRRQPSRTIDNDKSLVGRLEDRYLIPRVDEVVDLARMKEGRAAGERLGSAFSVWFRGRACVEDARIDAKVLGMRARGASQEQNDSGQDGSRLVEHRTFRRFGFWI